MTPALRNLASRARGVFLGAAVGDALGWPQEQNSGIVGGNKNRHVAPATKFRAWPRYAGSQYSKYVETVGVGEYSDDTQLILATARTVLGADWFGRLTDSELPMFLLYQRGAGAASLRACRSWATRTAPWEGGTTQKARKAQHQYFSAGGNGVAMRVAPHVVVAAGAPREQIVADVVRNGVTTHGHPRALVGAAAYAAALHILLTSQSTLEYGELAAHVSEDSSWQRPEIAFDALPDAWVDAATKLNPDVISWWMTAVEETKELLVRSSSGMRSGILGKDLDVLQSLGCFDKKINGAGTVTAAASIYLASRNAPRPLSGLVRAAFLERADTDTVASMTAGLLGALHGPDWLEPLSSHVQDHAYLTGLADQCTSRALGEERVGSIPAEPVGEIDLEAFRNRLTLASPELVSMPDGRVIETVRSMPLESRTNADAHRWMFAVEGQTMFVDVITRKPSPRLRDQEPEREPAPTGTLTRVSMLTPDPDAMTAFYGPLGLGLEVTRLGPNETVVDGTIRFIRGAAGHDSAARTAYLEVQVDDVDAALHRLRAPRNSDTLVTRLKDPAGNDVGVSQRKK